LDAAQSSWFFRQIASLIVIRRRFEWGAFGFALRGFFLFFSLFFLPASTRCPLPFSPISTVVWLECHVILVIRRVDIIPDNP
jgi:hypothetical protein